MIDLEQKVNVKCTHTNIEHFKNLGYEVGVWKDILVKAKDLQQSSNKKVQYTCDICGKSVVIKYQAYTKKRKKSNIDTCFECCGFKIGDKLRHTYEYVKQYFEDEGCILLEKTYVDTKTDMHYICQCGHENSTTFHEFYSGRSRLCFKCSREHTNDYRKPTMDELREIFRKENCELLSTKYINGHSHLDYKCSCGNISKTTLSGFLAGKRCGCNQIRGEKHYKYNHNLTDEERQMSRDYPEYRTWRKSVFEKDRYTCQCCGYTGKDIKAHHIKNYLDYPELRLDINNGITLCESCHSAFHSIYGNRNTTPEQLKEFIELNKDYHKEAI